MEEANFYNTLTENKQHNSSFIEFNFKQKKFKL